MKTEISKRYSWGFVVTEQGLRRIIQTAVDHLQKPVGVTLREPAIAVKLEDGAIIETSNVDDIFQLENAGSKLIVSIDIKLRSHNSSDTFFIDVLLTNPLANDKDWSSVCYTVTSNSRDWSFVTASEMDERCRRLKILSWEMIEERLWCTCFRTLQPSA